MADPILSPSARYVYETGLEVTPQQDAELRTRLECARQAHNAAVTIGRRRGQRYIDAVRACRARRVPKSEYPKPKDYQIGRYWSDYWAGPQGAWITKSWIGERITAPVTLSTVERVEKCIVEWIDGLYDDAKRTRRRSKYKRYGELTSVDSRSGKGITLVEGSVRWACRSPEARIRELLLPIRWTEDDPYLPEIQRAIQDDRCRGLRILTRTYGQTRRTIRVAPGRRPGYQTRAG
jgi:hypothetical protein